MTKIRFRMILPFVFAALHPQIGYPEVDRGCSPRAYCIDTGGQISETGKRTMYICCYPEKRKCLLSDLE